MSTCYCTAPATTGHLCTKHLEQLRAELWATPAVLRDLDVTLTGQDVLADTGSGAGTPDAYNEKASDARRDLLYMLGVAATAAATGPRTPGLTPAQLTARAVAGVQSIARTDGAHIIAQDLTMCLTRAQRCTDIREERIVYGPCSCGAQLNAPRSQDVARCRVCGAVWPVAEYRAFQHAQVLDHLEEQEGTLRQVCEWLRWAGHEVSLSTAQKWTLRATGPLIPVRIEHTGTGVYRYRDVREYAARHRKRSYALTP